MNEKTEHAIKSIIRKMAMNRKLTIATLYSSPSKLPLDLSADGHRVVVVGSSFRRLYRLWKNGSKMGGAEYLIVESSESRVPLKRNKLDVLIICDEIPGPKKNLGLEMVRDLLKPGGLLIWPHQSLRKVDAKEVKFVPVGSIKKRRVSSLCSYTSLLMEMGFQEIGQVSVPRRTLQWTVTTAKARARPWDRT